MEYPGIRNETFKLRLMHRFKTGDLLNGHLIILSTEKCEFGFVSNVCTEEDFYHKQFLIKYSQYLWF